MTFFAQLAIVLSFIVFVLRFFAAGYLKDSIQGAGYNPGHTAVWFLFPENYRGYGKSLCKSGKVLGAGIVVSMLTHFILL